MPSVNSNETREVKSDFAFGLRIRLLFVVLLVAVPALGFLVYSSFEQKSITETAVESRPLRDVVLLGTNKVLIQNILGLGSATLFAIAAAWFIGNRLIVREVKRLQEVGKLKDEFVSVASHELRTPMSAVKGIISMVIDGDYGPVNENLRAPLTDVFNSTERLIHLVNDLLNLSRIEGGRLKFTLSTFSLDTTISKVILDLSSIAKGKGIELLQKKVDSILIQADEEKVEEILDNVIGNSLKFTDHGQISVSTEHVGEFVEIRVEDTGIGIAKEDQSRLFRKFEQITVQEVGRPAGTGLGLYISRGLARKMGGDLWLVESAPGKRSIFAVTFPIAGTKNAQIVKTQLE